MDTRQHLIHKINLNSSHSNAPPPSYDSIISQTSHSPCVTLDQDENLASAEDDEYNVTINSQMQIKGAGNIIKMTPINSTQLASLLTNVLKAVPEHNEMMIGEKRGKVVNITVMCGAVVIGDRNVVGTGLDNTVAGMVVKERSQTSNAAVTSVPLVMTSPRTPPVGIEITSVCDKPESQSNLGKRKAEQESEAEPSAKRDSSL